MRLSGIQIQKFGRLRQTVPSLRCVERSTSILHLGTRRNPILLRAIHRSGADQFIVASNQDIPNFCRAKFQTVNEFNNKRKMEGHVTEVHKPLASACEISKYHDAFIFEEFGALIRRHSRVAEGLRREYPRLLPASLLSWNSTSVSRRNIFQLNFVQLPL